MIFTLETFKKKQFDNSEKFNFLEKFIINLYSQYKNKIEEISIQNGARVHENKRGGELVIDK